MLAAMLRGAGGVRTPAYVGGASTYYVGANSTYSFSLGGFAYDIVVGDLIIFASGWGSTTNGSPAVSGTTLIADLYSDDSRDSNLAISYLFATADGDPGSFTVTASGNVNHGNSVVAQVWRGVNPITPFDVTTVTATGINSGSPNSPSITPVTPGAVIISCGLGTLTGGGSAMGGPVGMEHVVANSSPGASTGSRAGIASFGPWVSGAYDPAAWSGSSNTADSWCAATLALRPVS